MEQYKQGPSFDEISSRISDEIVSSIYSLYLENLKTKDFFSIVIPIPPYMFFNGDAPYSYKKTQSLARTSLQVAVDFNTRKIRGVKKVSRDFTSARVQGYDYHIYMLKFTRHSGDPIQILVTCCAQEDANYMVEHIHGNRNWMRKLSNTPKKSTKICIHMPLLGCMIEAEPQLEHIEQEVEAMYASVQKYFKLNPRKRKTTIRIFVPDDQMPYSLLRKMSSGYSAHPADVITQFILNIQQSIRNSNCKRAGNFNIKYGTSFCGHFIKMPKVTFFMDGAKKRKVNFDVEILSSKTCDKCKPYMKKKVEDYLVFNLN